MATRTAGHHHIGASAPSEDPVDVGHLWSDTTTPVLKRCTSVSPITFVSTESGGSGAPADAQYLALATNGTLTSERVLTVANGIEGADAGAGSTYTIQPTYGTLVNTVCQGNDARLSDARTPTAHTHPVADLSDATANSRSLIQAANYAAMRTLLDLEAGTDFPALSTFEDHSARHENGGLDEISVAGLSGLLADAQTPLSHAHPVADLSDATANSRSLIQAANYAAMRTLLDLEVGVDFPALAHTHAISTDITGITGTPDGTKYLRDDFSWQAVVGGSGLTHPQAMARNVFGGAF